MPDEPLYTAHPRGDPSRRAPGAEQGPEALGRPGCARCGQSPCVCLPGKTIPLKQTDTITIRLDKSGRAGKGVTLLEGFRMHPEGKLMLLATFKKKCGAGGTLKNGVLEIQGDQRERLMKALEAMGYRVKKAGG